MKITKEVVEAIKKTQASTIEEISSKENWAIEKTEIISKGWKELIKNLEEISKEKDVNKLFLLLFAYLNTGDMLAFAMELNKHKPEFFNDFFQSIEKIDNKEKEELAKFLTEKMLVIYRLNTIPKIFSEDRITALQIALTKY
jgi:hypothetical protein